MNAHKKGKLGESLVKKKLKKYKFLLNDVTLKIGKGQTTQIDHILFTENNIYVIETKHYSGKVKEESILWIQKVNKKKYRLYNPILQNSGHVRAISNHFGIVEEHIVNLVVFTGTAKLKTSSKNVIKIEKLKSTIKKLENTPRLKIKPKKLYKNLKKSRMKPGPKTDKKHIKNIRKNSK